MSEIYLVTSAKDPKTPRQVHGLLSPYQASQSPWSVQTVIDSEAITAWDDVSYGLAVWVTATVNGEDHEFWLDRSSAHDLGLI